MHPHSMETSTGVTGHGWNRKPNPGSAETNHRKASKPGINAGCWSSDCALTTYSNSHFQQTQWRMAPWHAWASQIFHATTGKGGTFQQSRQNDGTNFSCNHRKGWDLSAIQTKRWHKFFMQPQERVGPLSNPDKTMALKSLHFPHISTHCHKAICLERCKQLLWTNHFTLKGGIEIRASGQLHSTVIKTTSRRVENSNQLQAKPFHPDTQHGETNRNKWHKPHHCWNGKTSNSCHMQKQAMEAYT